MDVWLLVLITIIILGTILVKIGSVALRMTGLDQETASFQALSLFSGTGFTTRESELITKDRRRRKIARLLMISGNVGLAVAIAALLETFRSTDGLKEASFIRAMVILLGGGIVLWHLLVSRWMNRALSRVIERRLERVTDLSMPHSAEILKIGQGYGISEVRLQASHPACGRTLREVNWSAQKVLVLAIQRGRELINSPGADTPLQEGDEIICYGPVGHIRQLAKPEDLTASGRLPRAKEPTAS